MLLVLCGEAGGGCGTDVTDVLDVLGVDEGEHHQLGFLRGGLGLEGLAQDVGSDLHCAALSC